MRDATASHGVERSGAVAEPAGGPKLPGREASRRPSTRLGSDRHEPSTGLVLGGRIMSIRTATATIALGVALLLARAASAEEALPPTTVHTVPPFDPMTDGLTFENSGDFESPDGNCFGMSLVAIHNFLVRKAGGHAAATAPAHAPKVTTEAGPVDREELVSYLQQHTSQNPMHEAKLDNPKNVLAALKRIAATGDPEIFTMTGSQGGHANVVFGYENGALLLLDPNYPHRTIAWPFDFKTGFGKHPLSTSLGKGKDFYAVLKTAGATPYTKFRASRELDALEDAEALHKASLPRYPSTTVAISNTDKGPVVIQGTVTGGPRKDEDGNKAQKPTRVWLTVDDQPVAHANVRPDGSFRLTLPKGVVTAKTKQVHVVVTIDEKDQNAQNKVEDFHMFAGYVDVDARQILTPPSDGIANHVGGHTPH
jgi:hypothetical protein